MVNKCCVPGCQSNYKRKYSKDSYVSCFLFPTDPHLKDIWIRKIPRKNLKVTKYTVICEKHFIEDDITFSDTFPVASGDIVIKRRKKKLKAGSVPCIFEYLPSYLSSNQAPRRKNPCSIREKYEDCFVQFLEKDKVVSFEDLKNDLDANLDTWNVPNTGKLRIEHYDDFLHIYIIEFSENCGFNINFHVRIDNGLSLKLWCRNVQVKEIDLSWVLSKECKLERWSQLQNIISHYSSSLPDKDDMLKDGVININCAFCEIK